LVDKGGEGELDTRRGKIAGLTEACRILEAISSEIANSDNPDGEMTNGNTD
jgi:hypothetical protein